MPAARTPIHSGEILKDELYELGISAAELARQIEVPANRAGQILAGRRAVTADTALRLAHWFGTSAELWMNLQQTYELDVARLSVGEEIERLPTLTTIAGTGSSVEPPTICTCMNDFAWSEDMPDRGMG